MKEDSINFFMTFSCGQDRRVGRHFACLPTYYNDSRKIILQELEEAGLIKRAGPWHTWGEAPTQFAADFYRLQQLITKL